MSYNPISYLGLSCPSGGDFYICQESKARFLGCCGIDPCDDGCPSSALYSASFDPSKHYTISAQSCVTGSSALWYTCVNGPTFLGCCTSNPCNNEGVCPDENLAGARLADDPSRASAFLTATITAPTVTSPTSITSTTSTPASTIIPGPTLITASKGGSPGPNTAGIVGGILGGLIILILIGFVFFRCRRRRRRKLPGPQLDEDVLQPPWSLYHDSHGSPTVPPASVSLLSMTSTRHKSLSATLSSIIGFKRGSTARRQSFEISDWVPGMHNNTQASPSFPGPVAELESLPPGRIIVRGPLYNTNTIHYEVEGSTVGIGPR
ncbi:hypothetical protein F4803DRAFT_565905 [Xylaria telfairii]|nr:hypothetical protein F4803DRAFT_565905 [Xylaria telfairii]